MFKTEPKNKFNKMDRQTIFNKAYNKARKTFSVADSIKIADKVLKSYSVNNKVIGKKSFAINKNIITSVGNVIDILVGYPEPDTEQIYGGNALNPNGWKNIPKQPMTFDLNHFNFDMQNGVPNNLDEKWQNFGVRVDDWYYSDDGLRAKAYVPNTELGEEFKKDYESGKYGISIEYDGFENNGIIDDWNIIGGTFHSDPSYTKTKKNNN